MLLCRVTLLQFMEKVADREASEHVVYHLEVRLGFGTGLRRVSFDGVGLFSLWRKIGRVALNQESLSDRRMPF